MREAKAASALNHPNIITIHDIAEAVPSGAPQAAPVDYIVMEYVEGQSLGQLMAAGSLSVEEAMGYAVQIAAALAAAHAAGIVHRDIKPANIMVTPSGSASAQPGQIKVLDFGLAKLLERAADSDGSTRTAGLLTEDGAILGTTPYMSPGAGRRQGAGTPRTDVFSFGCVLYEMLARRRPFQGESNLSILTAILQQQPTPLKRLRPDVPAQLQDILSRCLEKDRDRRDPLVGRTSEGTHGLPVENGGDRHGVAPSAAEGRNSRRLATGGGRGGGRLVGHQELPGQAGPVALPEVERLIQQDEYGAAFAVARQAAVYIPRDPVLARLWPEMSSKSTSRARHPAPRFSPGNTRL